MVSEMPLALSFGSSSAKEVSRAATRYKEMRLAPQVVLGRLFVGFHWTFCSCLGLGRHDGMNAWFCGVCFVKK